MPQAREILPFVRGGTLFEGVSSPSDDAAKKILGQTYEVADVLHNTHHRVLLRAVQQDSASAYTVPATGATRFMGFQTEQEDVGRKLSGAQATAGALSKPLDDYYSTRLTSIADHDVCFVVEEGPCKVLSTSTTYTQWQAVTVAAGGKAAQAAAGNAILGYAMTAYASVTTNALIYVTREIRPSDPSG